MRASQLRPWDRYVDVRTFCFYWDVGAGDTANRGSTWAGLDGNELLDGGGRAIARDYRAVAVRTHPPVPSASTEEVMAILTSRFPRQAARLGRENVVALLSQMRGIEEGYRLLEEYCAREGWTPDVVVTTRPDVLVMSHQPFRPDGVADVRVTRVHPRFPDGYVVYPWLAAAALKTTTVLRELAEQTQEPAAEGFRFAAVRRLAPSVSVRAVPAYYEICRGESRWRLQARLAMRVARRNFEASHGAQYD